MDGWGGGREHYTVLDRKTEAPCWLIATVARLVIRGARGGQRRASPGHGARRRGKNAQEAQNADSLGSPGRSSASAQRSLRYP